MDDIQLIPASSGFDHRSAQKDRSHFPRIQQATGVEYYKMLFFDDEIQNVRKVRSHSFVLFFDFESRFRNLELAPFW